MSYKPISLNNISLEFPHKICFSDFSYVIPYGSRIAIIGRNGSGKTSLLQMIRDLFTEKTIGYVPQIIDEYNNLSGGQRFNKALSQALSLEPEILMLDEPTNHLDSENRKALMRLLKNYPGTLIIVSHDVQLLRSCIDKFWHIDNGKITIFNGRYDDYVQEIKIKRQSIEHELDLLNRQKKQMHDSLMQEQHRAAKSKLKGQKSIENRKWPTITSNAKALKAEQTTGRKKSAIENKKQHLLEELENTRLPEIILPKFSIKADNFKNSSVLSIANGEIGYEKTILNNIHLNLYAGDRLAITGNNGSGKTTLVKAILNDSKITRSGNWYIAKDIGYLDQHYDNLNLNKTVLENIIDIMPNWNISEIRRHLNDFLFRKTEEVNTLVKELSGGEKVRLSLAIIAAKTPKLLILDEITNNLDLETRQHVIEVLEDYPGSILIISHDEDFLAKIGIENFYAVK